MTISLLTGGRSPSSYQPEPDMVAAQEAERLAAEAAKAEAISAKLGEIEQGSDATDQLLAELSRPIEERIREKVTEAVTPVEAARQALETQAAGLRTELGVTNDRLRAAIAEGAFQLEQAAGANAQLMRERDEARTAAATLTAELGAIRTATPVIVNQPFPAKVDNAQPKPIEAKVDVKRSPEGRITEFVLSAEGHSDVAIQVLRNASGRVRKLAIKGK